MTGILVLTHGKFAEGICDAAELIMGKIENLDYHQISHGDDFNDFQAIVVKKIQALDQGEGVLVFVDLFGASPYNAGAVSKADCPDVEYRLITGLNLPMLLEACTLRKNMDVHQLAQQLLQVGNEGIREFFTEFEKERK